MLTCAKKQPKVGGATLTLVVDEMRKAGVDMSPENLQNLMKGFK